MYSFEKIPQYVFDILSDNGADVENIYIATYCDMDAEHNFCDTYIASTNEYLYVLSGFESLVQKENAHKGLDRHWVENDYREYKLSDIEEISVEELISSSRLVAKTTEGEAIFLSAMTNFCKANAGLFCKYFSRIKKGEITSANFEIDKEDDPKENACPKCGMRYPDRNRKICPRCMEKGKLFSRFATLLLKYKKEIIILLCSLIVMTVMGILSPYFSKGFFFDEILDKGGSLYGEVLVAVGIVIATQILIIIADMINGYISTKIAAKIVYDLKNTIFGAIEKLSMGFFSSRQTGGLMTQVNNDSNTIYSFFCDDVPTFLVNVVQVVVLVIVLFSMNPLLAALSLVTVPVFFVTLRRVYAVSNKLYARDYSAARKLTSQLSDVLGGIRVVKAFSKENEEEERFQRYNVNSALVGRKRTVFVNYAYSAINLILYLGNIAALGVGGYMVIRGIDGFTYGKLITFTAYVNMIYSPMNFFSSMIDRFAACTNALQRLYEIYDTEPDITEKENAVTLEKIHGRVEFKNVDFGY
ncbi:MAG: hypothetical protein IJZ20_02025, partial [Clostridia bacterium]|nr:hypothetical protein [Clostridia bacterium]